MRALEHLPPEIRSEITARMQRQAPESMVTLFREMGPEFEEFVQTAWFAGYSEAMCEIAEMGLGDDPSPLLQATVSTFGAASIGFFKDEA